MVLLDLGAELGMKLSGGLGRGFEDDFFNKSTKATAFVFLLDIPRMILLDFQAS